MSAGVPKKKSSYKWGTTWGHCPQAE